jgi:hypothetical protein
VSFIDVLKLKWQEFQIQRVNKISNEEILNELALKNPDIKLREAAINNISDEIKLYSIAKYIEKRKPNINIKLPYIDDFNASVRCASAEKIHNQEYLYDIAINEENLLVIKSAILNLNNQKYLYDVYQKVSNYDDGFYKNQCIRVVIEKLNDPDVLYEIYLHDDSEWARISINKKLLDKDNITKIENEEKKLLKCSLLESLNKFSVGDSGITDYQILGNHVELLLNSAIRNINRIIKGELTIDKYDKSTIKIDKLNIKCNRCNSMLDINNCYAFYSYTHLDSNQVNSNSYNKIILCKKCTNEMVSFKYLQDKLKKYRNKDNNLIALSNNKEVVNSFEKDIVMLCANIGLTPVTIKRYAHLLAKASYLFCKDEESRKNLICENWKILSPNQIPRKESLEKFQDTAKHQTEIKYNQSCEINQTVELSSPNCNIKYHIGVNATLVTDEDIQDLFNKTISFEKIGASKIYEDMAASIVGIQDDRCTIVMNEAIRKWKYIEQCLSEGHTRVWYCERCGKEKGIFDYP